MYQYLFGISLTLGGGIGWVLLFWHFAHVLCQLDIMYIVMGKLDSNSPEGKCI